jgi:carboxypeptidase C (cathepsin A)
MPYFAKAYTLGHLGLDAKLRANISTDEFRTGHMIYIDGAALARPRHAVSVFTDNALYQ